ncbi:uncharacterized protein LOC105663982 [Megachile rotundata]|uniref:uncharacterized protein LOC105663982 n=1 Tax=Megachile rotundata TaxID=143995 RepID=UPI00061510C6|nr:PREDICTED: uncharacterized protein LOC105663982 [Megachile rotundata]
MIAQANVLIEGEQPSIAPRRNTTDSVQTASAPMTIKLPEMRLPTFDGNIENWSSFFDSFSSMIDQNCDLTPVQKLQYLRSTLAGRAAACIQCLSTTDANYADAIELLKEKYDCKRKILIKHCDAILSFPKLSRDSPEALGELVDTIRQNLRSLKNLRIDVSSWDCILVTIILSKISSDTAWHWELSLKDKEMPSYIQFLDFLEKRASCVPPSSQKTICTFGQNNRTAPAKPSGNRYPTRSHAFVTTNTFNHSQQEYNSSTTSPCTTLATSSNPATTATPAKCPICHGIHGIWRCERFHSWSVDARIAAVKKASLCQNCFRIEHNPEICKKGFCRICRQQHHTLLHKPRNSSECHEHTPMHSRATSPVAQVEDE